MALDSEGWDASGPYRAAGFTSGPTRGALRCLALPACPAASAVMHPTPRRDPYHGLS